MRQILQMLEPLLEFIPPFRPTSPERGREYTTTLRQRDIDLNPSFYGLDIFPTKTFQDIWILSVLSRSSKLLIGLLAILDSSE